MSYLFRYATRHDTTRHDIRFSVPHDRLFLDALERDLRREKDGIEPTSSVVGEPARSFMYVEWKICLVLPSWTNQALGSMS